jgi:hypothetical protein
MPLNNKQRSRWLSDILAELQRYVSKNLGSPEISLAQQAIARLQDARQEVREDAKQQGEAPCP